LLRSVQKNAEMVMPPLLFRRRNNKLQCGF
jgi:hypothetical protein